MALHKTERARAALSDHSVGLTAFERRILILSDGRRTAETLASMLGGDVRAAVERLAAAGYLIAGAQDVDEHDGRNRAAAAGPVGRLFGAGGAPRRDAQRTAPSAAEPATAQQAEIAPAAAPPPAPRRSLVASKMYVLDMLQLQRNAEARSFEAAIRACGDPPQLQAALLEALAFLQRTTPASYSRRVLDRVAEILPQDALAALQAQSEAIAAEA